MTPDEAIREGAAVSSDAASLLSQAGLFKGLDPEDLQRLAVAALSRHYKKGSGILYEGDAGDSLYVVASGHVKVFVTSSEGNELLLTTLGPGDSFGELALIDGGPRSASVEALEPCELLALSRPSLLEILEEYPTVTEALLTNLGRTIRRVSEQAADLVFLDLDGRVAKLLVQLADEAGEGADANAIDLGMSQSDLAAHIGGSRQSVNQSLHRFARRGYLTLDKRMVAVKDLERLRKRAGL